MSDICNISENVNKIDNARLIRKTNALMEVVGFNFPLTRLIQENVYIMI